MLCPNILTHLVWFQTYSVVRWNYVQLQSKLAGAKGPFEVLTQSTIASQSPRKEGAKTEWLEVALDCEK